MKQEYKANPVGNAIQSMIYGVPDNVLNSARRLRSALDHGIESEKFTVVRRVSHKFDPQGITMVYILGESSLTIHTYPEYHCIEMELSTCRGPYSGEVAFNAILSKIPHESFTKKRTPTIKDKRFADIEHIVLGTVKPRNYFMASGTGESDLTHHAGSYHMALEEAGVAPYNIMPYSSMIPKNIKEIENPHLLHGSELKVIQARADSAQGERATACVAYGWLYDYRQGGEQGGVAAEYAGSETKGEAEEIARASLDEIARASFGKMELKNINVKTESFVPSKRFGSSVVLMCFPFLSMCINGELG